MNLSNTESDIAPPERRAVQLVDDREPASGIDQREKLDECQRIIGYQFRDESLLLSALTHASGAAHRLASNERLEFLGDAVLGLTVCQWLYEEYPEYSEGDLTKIKSSVVSRRSCGRVACELQLDRCLIVGRGVTQNRSFPRSLVSDVFEAIVAAVYLDGGTDVIRQRLKVWLAEEVRHAVESQGLGKPQVGAPAIRSERVGRYTGVPTHSRLRTRPSEVVPDGRGSLRPCLRPGVGKQQERRGTTGGGERDGGAPRPTDPLSHRPLTRES